MSSNFTFEQGVGRKALVVATVLFTIFPILAIRASFIAGRVQISINKDTISQDVLIQTPEFSSHITIPPPQFSSPHRLLYTSLAPLSFRAVLATPRSRASSSTPEYEVQMYYFLRSIGYEWNRFPAPERAAGTARALAIFDNDKPTTFEFPDDLITTAQMIGLPAQLYSCLRPDGSAGGSQKTAPTCSNLEFISTYFQAIKGYMGEDTTWFRPMWPRWAHFAIDIYLIYTLFFVAILPYMGAASGSQKNTRQGSLPEELKEQARAYQVSEGGALRRTAARVQQGIFYVGILFHLLSTCFIAVEVRIVKHALDSADEDMGLAMHAQYGNGFFLMRMLFPASIVLATLCWTNLEYMCWQAKQKLASLETRGISDKQD